MISDLAIINGSGKEYFLDERTLIDFLKDTDTKVSAKGKKQVGSLLEFSGKSIRSKIATKDEILKLVDLSNYKFTYAEIRLKYYSRARKNGIDDKTNISIRSGAILLKAYHPSALIVDFFDCNDIFTDDEIISFYRNSILEIDENGSFPQRTMISEKNLSEIFDDPAFIRRIRTSPTKVINFMKNNKVRISKETSDALKNKCMFKMLKDGPNRLIYMIDNLVKK